MSTAAANVRIGTSGYQYDHWRGRFYPEHLKKKEWFEHYAEHFDTVEINNTFYHLPGEETFRSWAAAAPDGFCFVLKFSRYGSHLKCLKDPEASISVFLDGARLLGDHLGPILVQLKPNWTVNLDRLSGFLAAAPSDQRWALEFRHPSWLCDDVYALLRRHNAALCIHDQLDNHPHEVTADWVYLRFHGANDGGNYSSQYLTARADEVACHAVEGRDVYAYFNNDARGYAVDNARDLKRHVDSRLEDEQKGEV